MIDCLVVGGNSPIGSALRQELQKQGCTLAWTSRRRNETGAHFLDLDTLDGLDGLPDARTTIIVAAETRFAVCASEPQRTHRINVDAPVAIAEKVRARGRRTAFLSSIAVHDGSLDTPNETVPPTPNSFYGKQKFETEQRLSAIDGGTVLLRPSKVVTPDFAMFHRWIDAFRRGESVEAFSDMVVAPISMPAIVTLAARLALCEDATGIFQWSATDQASYATIARWIAESVGADPALVRDVNAMNGSTKQIWLPLYAMLGSNRAADLFGMDAPTTRSTLNWFLAQQSLRVQF